jgi:hypothetical protein
MMEVHQTMGMAAMETGIVGTTMEAMEMGIVGTTTEAMEMEMAVAGMAQAGESPANLDCINCQ